MNARRPIFFLAILFCLGIILAEALSLPFWLWYLLSFLLFFLSLAALKKGLSFDLLLCALVFLLGALLLSNFRVLPRHHISRFLNYKDNANYAVKGVVISEPALRNKRLEFILRSEEIRVKELSYRCYGDILVSLKNGKNISCADELHLYGRLYRAFSKWNNYKKDALLMMKVEMPAHKCTPYLCVRHLCVPHLGGAYKLLLLKRFSIAWKKRIETIIFQNTSRLSAGILDAMLLGEKRSIPPVINNYMIKSGTIHILVVSGFNVGILGFAVFLFLKVLRMSRNIRLLMTLPILCIYCLMTGASTPVVRATVMAIFFILAVLLKREADIYNALGLAIFFILSLNPYQLFDIGFQLSFASVLSIVYLFPKFKGLLRIERIQLRFLRLALEGCLVSFSAWLGTMGFIAYYFRILSPVTVLANLFIVPLATLITLCGFSLVVANYFLPCLIEPIAATSELLVALLLHINTIVVRLPAAYFLL